MCKTNAAFRHAASFTTVMPTSWGMLVLVKVMVSQKKTKYNSFPPRSFMQKHYAVHPLPPATHFTITSDLIE